MWEFFCIGKKGYEQLKTIYGKKIIEHVSGIFKDQIDYQAAKNIAEKVLDRFEKQEFDICEIIYSKFKSALSQEPVSKQIIPAQNIKNNLDSAPEMPISYEPSKDDVLLELLPKNLIIQIYHQLLENSASEQGARMAAMESATTNANKMIKNLTLVYNRTRQANITRELIDIVSGANAV